jgi:hypothetical protein
MNIVCLTVKKIIDIYQIDVMQWFWQSRFQHYLDWNKINEYQYAYIFYMDK